MLAATEKRESWTLAHLWKKIVRKRGGIFKTALYILAAPVYLATRSIPKDNRLYVFGSCHGLHFADNSKYLFLYASKHVDNVTSVFFSRDKKVVRLLQDNGYHACYTFSLKGLKTAVRAKKCFISNSTHDIHTLLVGGAEIIQLWHGTPLKKICYDVDLKHGSFYTRAKYVLREILFKLFPYLNTTMTFDKLVIASDYVKTNFRSAFRREDPEILVLGQARNDSLADDFRFERSVFPEVRWIKQLHEDSECFITWMPTHRLRSKGATQDLVNRYNFDRRRLEDLLNEHRAYFVVKVHFLDARGLQDEFEGSDRISVYRYADPYPLLRYTDILMTDYSSVYFDFLLLNRPIIFTPFDYDQYVRSEADFYYDYNAVTPGEKCRNWNEAIIALDRILRDRNDGRADPFAEQRMEMRDRFNQYRRENCGRLVDRLFDFS